MSVAIGGAAIGSMLVGYLSKRGRKSIMFNCDVGFVAGALAMAVRLSCFVSMTASVDTLHMCILISLSLKAALDV